MWVLVLLFQSMQFGGARSTSSSKQKWKSESKKQETHGKTQDSRRKKRSSSSRGFGVWHFVCELRHKFKAITKKRWCPTSFPPRQRNRHRSVTQNKPIGWHSLPRQTDADYEVEHEHNRNVRCSVNQNQSVNTCQIEPWWHCSKKGVTNLRRLNLRTIHVALQRSSSKKSIWREAP